MLRAPLRQRSGGEPTLIRRWIGTRLSESPALTQANWDYLFSVSAISATTRARPRAVQTSRMRYQPRRRVPAAVLHCDACPEYPQSSSRLDGRVKCFATARAIGSSGNGPVVGRCRATSCLARAYVQCSLRSPDAMVTLHGGFIASQQN